MTNNLNRQKKVDKELSTQTWLCSRLIRGHNRIIHCKYRQKQRLKSPSNVHCVVQLLAKVMD